MYKITTRDGAVLYDVSYPDLYMVTEPRATLEIGQPGSVQFSLVPEHSLYNTVQTMETYVCALRENNEFFYGRIIDINVDETTGLKQIECAGALNFLEDGELHPIVAEQQEGEEQQEQGVELTAAQFFTRCIGDYNSDIQNDPKRMLYVGAISHSKSGQTKVYNIPNYTNAKSALESNLISEYGGYFRVRKAGNYHYIDWLDGYNEVNSSPIQIKENVQNQENAFSANDGVVTLIRPVGKNNLMLPEVTVVVNQTLLNQIGRIIQTVTFGDCDSIDELRAAAASYIARMGKGLGKTATVKVVDMHFLNNAVPYIRLGATYTNITGFVGEDMIVSGMELNFANPANDVVTLKNWKELNTGQTGGTSGRGTLSKTTEDATGSKGFQNIWKHITETEDSLTLHAKLISINAEHLVETATEFERYSRRTDEAIQTMDGEVHKIEGTGVFQNNDRITSIAGSFSIRYYVVPDSKKQQPGINPKQNHWYVCNQNYIVTEADINSGKEFFSNPEAALAGTSISSSSLEVGQQVCVMVLTNDTTAGQNKTYYTKGLALGGGTELTITEEGSEINVGAKVNEAVDGVQLIEGSALWTQKDHITGVCGEYEIVTDQQGNRTLVIKSGGGIKIRKNGTEFGLYDQDNLTSGIIVGKINDPNNDNKVLGTKVDIVASQVRVGSTSNVAAWMEETGGDIDNLQGLVADRATIGQLNALAARVGDIEADYISTEELSSADIRCAGLYTMVVDCETVDCGDVDCATINNIPINNFLTNATVTGSGATQTLHIFNAAGTEIVTFNKAASVSLSGNWVGTTYTVTASPAGVASPASTTISLDLIGSGNIIGAQVKEGNKIITSSGAKLEEDVSNKVVTCTLTGGSLGQIAQISTSNTYNAGSAYGHTQGDPISGTAGDVASGTQKVHNFTINRRDSTTSTIQIDCSSIYTAARKGYTLGTFTQATVKLAVDKTSSKKSFCKTSAVVRINSTQQTLYKKAASAKTALGTVQYFKSGTYYKAGEATTEQGDSEWVVPVGRAYSFVFQTVFDAGGSNPRNGWFGLYGASTLYAEGSGKTMYKAGKAITKQGISLTAYTKNTQKEGTAYYSAGDSFYPIGDEVTAYEKLTSGTIYYQAEEGTSDYYYKASTNTTDYYTKS